LAVLAAAVPVALWITDPDRPVKETQRRLAAGQPVTLIGETGPPHWSRSPTEKEVRSAAGARDKPFTMSSIEPSLLELLPDPQLPRYRFRAEVRHETGDGLGVVGIYFAYSQYVTAKGVEHRFWVLDFNDIQGVSRRRDAQGRELQEVALRCRRYRPWGEMPVCKLSITPGPHQWKHFAPAAPPDDPTQTWRRLAVEVTPEKVRAFWEGEAIGEVSSEQLRKVSREILTEPLDPIDPPAGDAPGVALGLYVHRSTATFRSVVIEPLEK
jgi:hypothetical protein